MTPATNPYEAPASTSSGVLAQGSARGQLLPVAIALLVLSILHIFGGLFYFAYVYSVLSERDADSPATHALLVYCMYYGISMLYCLLLAWGAISMVRQGSYVWAMTVCILALIPSLGPCYFLGIPIGLWGILVLRKPEVRSSFARA